VARGNDLKEIANEEFSKLAKEINEKEKILREKKIEYDQAVEKNDKESITKLSCSINNLENDLYLLRYNSRRAISKSRAIHAKSFNPLDELKPIQEEHILKGIQKFAKARKIKVDGLESLPVLEVSKEEEIKEAPQILEVSKESEVVLEESEELKEREIIQMQKTVILMVFLISLIISIVFISFSRNAAKLANS
ncbi:hypothetical protein NEMIN01_2348, partial [Nematocida minor]|uniref:uncharacterized protein n=1 Tax=Nematocida minor TaxID=1912983 RepID=UPI00221FA2C9